jgi:tripartite-type tricarboxylate transporter receptor subunit TctC
MRIHHLRHQKVSSLLAIFLLWISAFCAQAQSSSNESALRLLVRQSVPGAYLVTPMHVSLQNPSGKVLGKSVVIENKSGASGIIATNSLITSPPDGNTLQLMLSPSYPKSLSI